MQPPLPYSYQALEPYIDAQTMEIHYTKHHRGYVNNLNVAIAKHPELKGQSLEELIENFEIIPDDIKTSVRNNGGGHFNHLIFWSIMSPNGGGEPTGEIAKAIQKNFGDFEQFKTKFKEAGSKQFGSGWVWLMMTQEGKLEITNSPGQDSPIMQGNYPILGSDVWEHAYYLKYKSSRGDYLDAWWNVVNWDEVNKRFEEAKSIM
nr:superoxide dismutase [Rippkaea orientalis]